MHIEPTYTSVGSLFQYRPMFFIPKGTSIEHVYPRNADTANKDSDMEPLKNTLGNLTIMDPAQNTIGGNDNFIQKRSLYQNSSVMLTKEIGEKATWTTNEIENQQNLLIAAAVKIFRP